KGSAEGSKRICGMWWRPWSPGRLRPFRCRCHDGTRPGTRRASSVTKRRRALGGLATRVAAAILPAMSATEPQEGERVTSRRRTPAAVAARNGTAAKARAPRRTIPPEKRCNALDGKTWLQYSISVWGDVKKSAEELRLKHPALFPVAL